MHQNRHISPFLTPFDHFCIILFTLAHSVSFSPTHSDHIQGEANVCDDINGDMHLLREAWQYQNRGTLGKVSNGP